MVLLRADWRVMIPMAGSMVILFRLGGMTVVLMNKAGGAYQLGATK